tara:strand:- start:2028 stop:2210 length:183 start_codon:yes stop_codon:yes gene_type:complete
MLKIINKYKIVMLPVSAIRYVKPLIISSLKTKLINKYTIGMNERMYVLVLLVIIDLKIFN